MDPATRRRLWFWLPWLIALLAMMTWLFYPKAVAVDMVQAQPGPLQVTIGDEGETRVRDMFVISAPTSGFMRRVELEPGDKVIAGRTEIARIDPADPALLDARTLASGRATIDAAAFARKSAQAELSRAQAEADYAASELKRAEILSVDNAISKSSLDAARRQADAAAAQLQQAQANIKVRESEYQRARAQLWTPQRGEQTGTNTNAVSSDAVLVRAPVNGVVLRVLARSESFVQSGTPLVELGNARDLEVKVDLLSADAVKVQPGQRVIIDSWGGPMLTGKVRQVEPFGFTKVSALGIEEQRVRVIIDFTEPHERYRQLGHGYRVEPRIVVWESKQALQVPLSSLFRDQKEWAVFVVNNNRAELRRVSIGHQNGLNAEILSGLQPGEWIVSYPDDRIAPGVRVVTR
jgi:HlyD family secretion protein